jgi:hypothetical protein
MPQKCLSGPHARMLGYMIAKRVTEQVRMDVGRDARSEGHVPGLCAKWPAASLASPGTLASACCMGGYLDALQAAHVMVEADAIPDVLNDASSLVQYGHPPLSLTLGDVRADPYEVVALEVLSWSSGQAPTRARRAPRTVTRSLRRGQTLAVR